MNIYTDLWCLPVNKAAKEFRMWNETATAKGRTLNRILCVAKTYNCSSAECERGFSAANNSHSNA